MEGFIPKQIESYLNWMRPCTEASPHRFRQTFLPLACVLVSLLIDSTPSYGEGTPQVPQVIISEVLASNKSTDRDNYGDRSDWLELHNLSSAPVDLWDWTISDDLDQLDKWWIPSLVLLPGGSTRIWCSGRNEANPKAPLHTNFKLSAKGETIYLTRPYENTPSHVFDFEESPQYPDISFGVSGRFLPTEILVHEALGHYFVPIKSQPPDSWFQLKYDDSKWPKGVAPFGMDRRLTPTNSWEIRTDLSMVADETASKAYFRFPFSYTAPPIHLEPQLSLRFSHGIVAYLNGNRIARTGILKGSEWDAQAQRFVAKGTVESLQNLTLDNIRDKLRAGQNVLALEVSFGEGKSIDFHIAPLLRLIPTDSGTLQPNEYLVTPSPGRLNSQGFSNVAPRPLFSKKGGFFYQKESIELGLPPGETGEIHYTLDGSLPNLSSPRYQQALVLTSSTQLQARSFQQDSLPSPTVAETYSSIESNSRKFTSNLPVVLIDTHHARITANGTGSMRVALFEPGSDGRTRLSRAPNFSGKGSIKLRGSSTLNRPKKGYRIELRNDQEKDKPSGLLGMPPDEDWILYGPYDKNKTLINNVLIYELSRRMGSYAPRTRFVEAFINEEREPLSMISYVGLYVLMESIKTSQHRVEVQKPGLGGESLSGGYIFKIDRRGPQERGFRAGMQNLVYVDPSEEKITSAQSEWLTQYLNRFFDALSGPHFSDPTEGYAAYVDVNSWIDQRFIQEITRNPDAYSLSTYFTKPRGKKLQLGPAWDFDRAFYFGADLMKKGYYERGMNWSVEQGYNWGKLIMDDPSFETKFRARGLEHLDGVWSASNVNSLIDRIADEIRESQVRNHRRWGHLKPAEWKERIRYLKRFLALRLNGIRGRFLPPPEISKSVDASNTHCNVELKTDHPGGRIFYTAGAADPITDEGQLNPNARLYEAPIQMREAQTLAAVTEVDGHWSDPQYCTCLPTDRNLVVTEIMYHPKNQQLEFIEFQNIGNKSISLDGLELSEAVDFDFSEGEVRSLAPNEIMLVVRDLDTFKSFYETETIKIAGQYEDDLPDTSGRILVQGPGRERIVDIFYSDSWYPETDSLGHSLMLAHPTNTPTGHDRDPRRWHPSPRPRGTPGSVQSSRIENH